MEYVGHKSIAEVNELLARAHIFVNTSTDEGFPNSSESELVAAVRTLTDKPEVRAGYVLRGHEHAAANHSLRNAEEGVRLIESWRRKAG